MNLRLDLITELPALLKLPACVIFCLTMLVLAGCNTSGSANTAGSANSSCTVNCPTPLQAGGTGDLNVVKNLPPPSSAGNTDELRISENDLLSVDVFQVNDLDREVRVAFNGKISMPLIGDVDAAGLTLPELERRLESRYGEKYLQSPNVTVFLKESAGQQITMDGEFRKTGTLKVNNNSSLLKVVSRVGGLSSIGDNDKIFIYRTYDDGNKVAQYSITKIRKNVNLDPRVYGGDVIVAFASNTKIATQTLKQALGLAGLAAKGVATGGAL